MSPQDMRSALVDRTIKVIATEGLDKTTTKAITLGTGINEVYIYRHFSSKEDLLSKAFDSLDTELVCEVMYHFSVMEDTSLDYETRCRIYFNKIWGFLLGNRDKCLAFVRYYYSPYFARISAKAHKERYGKVIEMFSRAFIDEADVWMILNHIINVMLDFAVKVHNGQMSEEDDYAEHVFRVIYASVKQYFRDAKEK